MMREEPNRPRIVVTAEELRTAFRVWMMVIPSYLWRRHEQFQRLKADKRSIRDTMSDPRSDLADYMADKFFQAGWTASYPKPPVMVDNRLDAGAREVLSGPDTIATGQAPDH
jgi:hypothetical protein